MALLTIPQAVRGSISFGHVGDASPTPLSVAAGPHRDFVIAFPSSDWVDVAQAGTLGMDALLERSLDGGTTWIGFGGFSGAVNGPGKGGVTNPPALSASWDGQAMQVRGGVTVRPGPFTYGITVT